MDYLKGKKILLLAPELENNEHRGIAAYTKALIKALNDSGAEIWLTTSSNLKELKIKRLKESTRNYIYTTYVLDGMLQSITLVAHVAVFELSVPATAANKKAVVSAAEFIKSDVILSIIET